MTRIRVGDEVIVISGKDTGKRGKVVRKLPKEDRIMIEGINMFKKHVKPTRRGQASGIVEGEGPLYASKVALICSRCGKRTRVGMKTSREEGQLRFCKKCGEVID